MELITCDKSLIDKTSKFASEVFIDYYNNLIGNKQATYMANLFLSKQKINELIDNGAMFRLLVEDDKIIGFSEYLKEENKVFLSKLYVQKDYRGKGYGRILFEDCLDYTKRCGLDTIYLTVNKHNTPSYETYLHLGFKVTDSVVNDIGEGYVMDDYIMEYKI